MPDDPFNAAITWLDEPVRLREDGPLAGRTLLVKDLFDTAGIRTTYGSRIYADHVPDRDPTPSTPIPQAKCPPDLAGCREVSGRVLYVEAVDPDGDGDAHFVTADAASVTGPGITVIDVSVDLRPNPLPGVGAEVTAAGTVATGSHGQSQIEAVAFESD